MLGSKIKKYRELKNLTQEELADILYISPKTLGHYETGARDCRKVDVLAALTETLGFSVLIKKGKIYIEEDFKMNKKTIKSKLMDMNETIYKGVIKEYCYGCNHELSNEEKNVINSLYDTIKHTDICKIIIGNKLISLESALYESEKFYFLDLRGFDDSENVEDMIDAYMVIYHKDTLLEYDEYVDDVWFFDDWKAVE